jgi:hypothetical protein
MSEFSGAQIIPFPTRELPPDAVTRIPTEPSQAEARLNRALNGLKNALAAQRAAMSAWKSALGDLQTVTGRLGANLRNHNDGVRRLDEGVKALRTEAVKLEGWADDALEKQG